MLFSYVYEIHLSDVINLFLASDKQEFFFSKSSEKLENCIFGPWLPGSVAVSMYYVILYIF